MSLHATLLGNCDIHKINELLFISDNLLTLCMLGNYAFVVVLQSTMLNIGIAPITQVTHMHNKNSNIQGRSPNVIKVLFHTIRNCS